jgi:hypothetical protein
VFPHQRTVGGEVDMNETSKLPTLWALLRELQTALVLRQKVSLKQEGRLSNDV